MNFAVSNSLLISLNRAPYLIFKRKIRNHYSVSNIWMVARENLIKLLCPACNVSSILIGFYFFFKSCHFNSFLFLSEKKKNAKKVKIPFDERSLPLICLEKKTGIALTFIVHLIFFKHLIQINFQIKFKILRYFYW